MDPLDFTDHYNTPLDPYDEQTFLQWAKANNRLNDSYDYDMRGAWKAGAGQAGNGHYPDTFKKPNHPTFSDQSQYHGQDGFFGGRWAQAPDGSWDFVPGSANLHFRSSDDLQDYFRKVEPGNRLKLKP
jgi:hypothetical protein